MSPNLINLYALGPWMTPDPVNLYALVPWVTPNLINLYALVDVTKPYEFIGATDVTKPQSIYMLWGHG
jgi:hypothetical protein